MNKNEQKVLVVPRKELFKEGTFEGIKFDPWPYWKIVEECGFFMKRSEAEENPAFKQIIPYTLIVRGIEIYVYERGKSGEENRLHTKMSCGIGGHVDQEDVPVSGSISGTIWGATERELREEITVRPSLLPCTSVNCVGVLNSETDPVNQVHFGLIMRYSIDIESEVNSNEHDIHEASFVPMDIAKLAPREYEKWTEICLPYLYELSGLLKPKEGLTTYHSHD